MNEYIHGQIWEDRFGDEWEVTTLEKGVLLWNSTFDIYHDPSIVESGWGPLKLKEHAMADWEKDLLDEPPAEVQFNQVWINPKDEKFYRSAESKTALPLFQVAEDILDRLDPVFVGHAVGVYEEALELLLRKNADYGHRNISETPGGPLNGLRVRMHDKWERLNNLMDSGLEPENESLRDSFMDIANYGLIALLVLDGKWPGVNKENTDRAEEM